jgi:hypothetical protein
MALTQIGQFRLISRLARFHHVFYWQILLQNSENAARLIFREKTKQAAVVDRCGLEPATKVPCKFVTG